MRRWIQRSWLVALSVASAPALAAPAGAVVTLEDPRGDDRGPGGYIYPTGSEYRPGDFDLRRFTVRVDGNDAVIDVTLGANVRRNVVQQRGDSGDLILENGIYVQNVDVYVDTTPGEGFTEGLPGRRVAFPPESGWDRAIAIVPRPGPTRTELRSWNADAARAVITPGPVRTAGTTLTVRVPLAFLGGAPQTGWGWSVMVSGAAWESSFSVVDRFRGVKEAEGFVLPVYGVPEERAFGGGKLNSGAPYVIDVMLPAGVSQADVLGNHAPDRPAVVPMVYPDPARAREIAEARSRAPAPSAPPAPSDRPVASAPPAPTSGPVPLSEAPTHRIASLDGDAAVIPTPEGSVKLWQFGTVVDDQGHQLGRVVVTQVANGFVLATVTDGKGRVQPGNRVKFPPPARPTDKP